MFRLPFLKGSAGAPCLGLDIGTTSIKIAEVAFGGKTPRIVNYALLESRGSLARANTALQTSTLKLFDEEIRGFLRSLIAKMAPKARRVVASIPPFSAFTTVLSFPEMSPTDLEKAIAFQASQYIPLPISEVALDWSKVGSYEDDKGFKHIQILLTSVPHEHIRKYRSIVEAAGLSLQAIEIESMSLVRMLVGGDPTPTVIVDVGARSTSISIVEGGTLRFVSQTDFAGFSLTQALATSLNINPVRAEELKRERGVAGTGPNYELSTIMLPFLDGIISEVKRTDFSYHSQFPNAPKFERIILSGGGANLLGIQKYFQDQMGVPVVKAAPFVKFEYDRTIEPLVPELNPLMSVALGLAMRQK